MQHGLLSFLHSLFVAAWFVLRNCCDRQHKFDPLAV
jgi:hypothetical protein